MQPKELPALSLSTTGKLLVMLACGVMLVWLSAKVYAQGADTLKLQPSRDKIAITEGAEYVLLDHQVSAETIASDTYNPRWQPYHGQGMTGIGDNNDLWLRFTAEANGSIDDEWWLVIYWPVLSHAQLSEFDHSSGEWRHRRPMGISHSRSNRIIRDRNLIYPLDINQGGRKTYYLNIRSQSLLSVPVDIWRSEQFSLWSQIDLLVIGGILGALLIMLLYNVSLSVLLKDRVYWFYCLYVFTVILYLSSSTGLGAYYVWHSKAWLIKYSVHLTSLACFSAATVFVRHFLKLPQHGGWLLWGNNFLLLMWTSLAFSLLLVPIDIVEVALNLGTLVSTVIAIATGVVLWQRNFPTAKIFLLSWGVLIIGTLVFVLALQGALPFNVYTRYAQMVGFSVELVLLSVALAYRINMEIKEREAAQTEALILTQKVSSERRERLKAQMENLDMQRQLTDDLERHVVERTEQLNDAMVKLEHANAELTKLSVTDPLTKLHNRRYFDDTLINEYKRALRTKQPLGLIVADIDHFKSINDTYGHSVGDQCIAQVADALQASVHRPGDLVARYGGEEFVLVVPSSDEHSTFELAEQCRHAVETLEFASGDKNIPLTISAGVAAWVPTEEGAYKQLLNAADTALYRAKNSGRNCVKTASERGKLVQL